MKGNARADNRAQQVFIVVIALAAVLGLGGVATDQYLAAVTKRQAGGTYRAAKGDDIYTGALLYMLARGNGARGIVEFGTSFGLSTIHLAAALRDNGGGKLIGTEFEPNKLVNARANLEAAGLAERDVPDYIEVDHAKGTAKMTRIPGLSEVPYPTHMEPNLVIEFYSR